MSVGALQGLKVLDLSRVQQHVEAPVTLPLAELLEPILDDAMFEANQNGKQLILTSDRAPVLLQGIEERLLTRFKWGMVAELEKRQEISKAMPYQRSRQVHL